MTYSPGDIVYLKSGGPAMTIIETRDTRKLCQWFDGGKASNEWFWDICLTTQDPSKPVNAEVDDGGN